jgi:hypothetical protein
MKTKTTILLVGMQVLLLAAMVGNLWVTLRHQHEPPPKPPLPCSSLPMNFIHDYPECADHLLQSMNITRIRIVRANESDLFRVNRSDRLLAIKNNASREAVERLLNR